MPQTQKTIRFNQLSDKLVAEICPTGEINYNFATNQIFHRYNVLCSHLKPGVFTKKEMLAICQAYNGKIFNADIELEAKAFSWQIKEAIAYDQNVAELLGDYTKQSPGDWPDFMQKIETLTIPEIIALFQYVHDFWTRK